MRNKVKFNGHLASRWAKVKPGQLLSLIIREFSLHIESENNITFCQYLNQSHYSKVQLDFDIYYNHFDYIFGIKSKIPF